MESLNHQEHTSRIEIVNGLGSYDLLAAFIMLLITFEEKCGLVEIMQLVTTV